MKDFVAPKPKQKAAAAARLPTLPSIHAELCKVFHDEIVKFDAHIKGSGKSGLYPHADRLVLSMGIMDMAHHRPCQVALRANG